MLGVVCCTSKSPNTAARSGQCSRSGKRFPGTTGADIFCATAMRSTEVTGQPSRKEWGWRKCTAPRSPWQNPYVERLIGSIRHECLDHIIVWNERSLRRTLQSYFACYLCSRTHLALANDAPESRVVEIPERGRVVAIPQVGGLHHRYQREAA